MDLVVLVGCICFMLCFNLDFVFSGLGVGDSRVFGILDVWVGVVVWCWDDCWCLFYMFVDCFVFWVLLVLCV